MCNSYSHRDLFFSDSIYFYCIISHQKCHSWSSTTLGLCSLTSAWRGLQFRIYMFLLKSKKILSHFPHSFNFILAQCLLFIFLCFSLRSHKDSFWSHSSNSIRVSSPLQQYSTRFWELSNFPATLMNSKLLQGDFSVVHAMVNCCNCSLSCIIYTLTLQCCNSNNKLDHDGSLVHLLNWKL